MTRLLNIFAMAVVVLLSAAAHADSFHLILSGSGGEPEYSQRFADWGMRLENALKSVPGVKADRILWLAEPSSEISADAQPIDLESIRRAFETIAARAGANDDVYVYIIGHGSAYSRTTKFHIPGPDASAEDFGAWLDGLKVRRVAILNSTPASAGFINVLSGSNRVVCSATKSQGEFNATRFMEYFVRSLEDGSADRNRDERVSFLENCAQASELTAAWYTTEGLIPSEHAILDDNGDGLGTRLFSPEEELPAEDLQRDGKLAGKLYIKDYSFPDNVPRELVESYLAALDDIEAWKETKATAGRENYLKGLEERLLKASRFNRDIHQHLPPDTSNS